MLALMACPETPNIPDPVDPVSRERAWKAWFLALLKVGLTCLILWLALRRVSLLGLREALLQVRLPLALLSVLLFPLAIVPVEAVRYAFAARLVRESQPTLWTWIQVYGESRPFFYLLPAAVGAEGMVWLRLRQVHWRHASCAFVVLINRLAGVGVWALVAALALREPDGVARILAQAPAGVRSPLPWALLGAAVLGAIAAAPRFFERFRGLPVAPRKALPLLTVLLLALHSALVTGWSIQAASRAAGTPLPLVAALGFLALFNFAMVLPISLGGFGVQEALILALGLPLGYPAPALLAFSAVVHLQRLGLALGGLVLFLMGRRATQGPLAGPS